jgi:hypothetical protein
MADKDIFGRSDRDYEREYVPKNVSSGWTDYDRSFPTQDQADRFDYGYAQMWNRPGDPINRPDESVVGPWLHGDSGDIFNPSVFERQLGLASFPGAAKKYAQLSNEGFYQPHFDSPSQLRNLIGYANVMNADPSLQNSMYADLYGPLPGDDSDSPVYSPEMYTSKREQVEDEENTFVANLMENYGRDNPFLQELGGMETTEVTSPRGDVTTTEEYIDDGYNLRDLSELIYGYPSNLDPLPSDRQPGLDWRDPFPPSNIGSDRAGPVIGRPPSNIGYDRAGPISSGPPSNIGFARAGAEPALPPSNLGFARAGAEPALPPPNIGFARAGAEQALPPSNIGYDRAGPRRRPWWEIW